MKGVINSHCSFFVRIASGLRPRNDKSCNSLDNLSRRDYRSVEENDATKFRMPLGMRPVCGCIPTACKACKTAIFLPSEPFLTECCNCHHFVRLKIYFHKTLAIASLRSNPERLKINVSH